MFKVGDRVWHISTGETLRGTVIAPQIIDYVGVRWDKGYSSDHPAPNLRVVMDGNDILKGML